MTSVWRVGAAGAAWLLVAVASAAAQMAGSASAGCKRTPRMTSAPLPAPLREIRFDQNLRNFVLLDTEFSGGRVVPLLHRGGEWIGSLTVTCCSIVAAIRTALFLAWSAIVPVKRSSTVV